MGKMYTRFQTKTVQRLYPLGRHIPTMAYIWGYPGNFNPDLPRSQGSLSGTGRRENPGNEVGPCILAPSCKKTMQLIKKRFFILVKSSYILVFSYFFSLPLNRFRCPNTVYAISEFQNSQNEPQCKTFLVKMSFIFTRIKTHFLIAYLKWCFVSPFMADATWALLPFLHMFMIIKIPPDVFAER